MEWATTTKVTGDLQEDYPGQGLLNAGGSDHVRIETVGDQDAQSAGAASAAAADRVGDGPSNIALREMTCAPMATPAANTIPTAAAARHHDHAAAPGASTESLLASAALASFAAPGKSGGGDDAGDMSIECGTVGE